MIIEHSPFEKIMIYERPFEDLPNRAQPSETD